MTTKKIEIERYIPNQELVINVLNHNESVKYSTFLYGSIAFLALLFSFLFWSPLPLLFAVSFILIFIKYQPNPFLKQGIFTANTLVLTYKTAFIEWTKEYELNRGIDWFVDLQTKPIAVQIGTNGKILLDFELANEHELPPLTDKISALTKMDFEDNQMTDKYEVLRFRPQHQIASNDDFYFIKLEKNQNGISIKVGMTNPFWIDLQKEILHYNSWFTQKSMPLRHIGSIYCEMPTKFNYGFTAEWYFYDKLQQENILFFTIRTGEKEEMDITMDLDYKALNFRNDMSKLKSVLAEIPAFSNIKIEFKYK